MLKTFYREGNRVIGKGKRATGEFTNVLYTDIPKLAIGKGKRATGKGKRIIGKGKRIIIRERLQTCYRERYSF